jgi:DNA-binding XRE family transcriptional regulator
MEEVSLLAGVSSLLAVLALSFVLLRGLIKFSKSELLKRFSRHRFAIGEWRRACRLYRGAVYLIDPDDHLVRGNQAFYDFIGCSPRDARGSHIMTLVHGEREKELCPVCRARLERRDAVFIKPSDDPMNRAGVAIGIIVKILRNAQGEVTGVLQVLQKLADRAAASGQETHGRYPADAPVDHATFLSSIEHIFQSNDFDEAESELETDCTVGPDHERKLLALKVRMLRLSHQWSQEDLAHQAGLDTHAVGVIEQGGGCLNPEAIEKLAIAFGLTAGELVPEYTGSE